MPGAAAFKGTGLDLAVVLIYFTVIVVFGMRFAKYAKGTKDFFFGGQRFSWWLIAFSCVATTVGSYSFQKYSEAGFLYGLSSTQTYLNDWFWMPILLFVWLPIIYYQRIISVPEYFERRFGRPQRAAATFIILLYLVAYIGINLFVVGQVMQALLGWDVFWAAAVTTVAVTAYVYVGGQTSVIMTDLVQGIILLVAGLGLFFAGVAHLGGWIDFWSLLPQGHRFAFSEFSAPDTFSFIGIYAQDGLVNSGAFMLMNQGIIMRFLSLKSVKDARRMTVCWLLVLAPLAAVATSGAGWIGAILEQESELQTEAKNAFVDVAHFLCAPGIFGFVLAALTAALMSTADTLINAVSAVFVNDIYRPYLRANRDDKHYLRVARITSLCAAAAGLLLVPVYITRYDSTYQAHAMVTASIPAPMVVAILLAVLWRRYTPAAALATLVGGTALVMLSFYYEDALIKPFAFGMGPGSYTFMRALYGLVVCAALGVGVSLLTKPQPAADLEGLVTGTQLAAIRLFKGGEPNRRPGGVARLTVKIDGGLEREEDMYAPQWVAETLATDIGDLVYAADARWWFGGLRSVHGRLAGIYGGDTLRISPAAAEHAHFRDGQRVCVEKIL